MMKIHRHGMEFVVAAIVVALLSSAASAGTILPTPAPGVSGPGLGFATVAAIVTVQPNNDNVPAAPPALDNNLTVPLKRFDFADYIDIEFSVQGSEGVTEYQVTEFVDNNTGSPWSSYQMVLGHGTGGGFVISAAGDDLDFDSPNYDTPPTSTAFSSVNTSDPDKLTYSTGVHGGGAQQYLFRIDVPDQGGFGGKFTLRQIPTAIPEPTAIVLAGLALLGAGLLRRRG
jgi:hypothetical protein